MDSLKALESADLYTVGWIAVLHVELASATAMLDEEHDKPHGFDQPLSDKNTYSLGRIGEHNIVIAALEAGVCGMTSAATTAMTMVSSFPNIRFGLLVGVGAAAVRENGPDMRLGDIAVSTPSGRNGGVIQYDLLKVKSGQERESKSFLNKPPTVLLKALGSIRANHERRSSTVPNILRDTMRKYPKMAEMEYGYVHQGLQNDRLFKAKYNHVADTSCCNCDPKEEIQRKERKSTEPEIYYGMIASGSLSIIDAITRDRIVSEMEEECICFEMEAAGLMNDFPCLVIRGISDYADSHKNDRWQRYAAATAAAYAKELLSYIPSNDIQKTRKVIDIFEKVTAIHSTIKETNTTVEQLRQGNHSNKIKLWLSPPDPSTNFNNAKSKRFGTTGSWFLESEEFVEWKSGSRQCLWLHGIPGCGKTVLSSTIIEHLQAQEPSALVLDFFFDFQAVEKQPVDKLLYSLVTQLYEKCELSRKELDTLFSTCDNGQRQPTFESLCTTFRRMLLYTDKVQIIIDAMDECTTRERLLSWMCDLYDSTRTKAYVIATSRPEEELRSGIEDWLHEGNCISIQQNTVDSDIGAYINGRIHTDKAFKRWQKQAGVLEEIKNALMKKADGMFRWVACQLDVLKDCLDLRMLREALNSLPETLNATYSRILAKIKDEHKPYAQTILQFLTYSERPITIAEAVDAVVVKPDQDPTFDPQFRMPNPDEIVAVCSSLVSVAPQSDDGGTIMVLQLAHFSVKEYLRSKNIYEGFREGLNETRARANIVIISLAYLTHVDDRLSTTAIRHAFPLATYCAQYWTDHAKTSETEKNVQKSIMGFLNQQKKAYSLWGRLFKIDNIEWRRSEFYLKPMASPLYYASFLGLKIIVEMLLQKGSDVNAVGGEYGTALRAASEGGHEKIVQMLLGKGADVEAKSASHGHALHAASSRGHEKIVQMLLGKGADVNAEGGINGTALQAASEGGHEKIVQMLLEKGADVEAKSALHGNALRAASSRGHEKIVQMLLRRGADVNGWGGLFGSALQAASHGGHEKIVQLLLGKGADVNAEGGHYGNALQAASNEGHEKIVHMLLQKGAEGDFECGDYDNVLKASLPEWQ